jgi:SAM-dependent methyltransferase
MGRPRPELVRLIESGELKRGRAIDLGCGVGENVIYLAKEGFDASGVDVSWRAINKARRKAEAAGVSPRFLVGDVTNLTGIEGPFDLVLDNGCLHSLLKNSHQAYVRTVLRLTQPGSHYLLRCFLRDPEQPFSLFQPIQLSLAAFFDLFGLSGLVEPGEVERLFSEEFKIDCLKPWSPGLTIVAIYLMRRKIHFGWL